MAVKVTMPRLGWTMETGRVAEWIKHDGETVQAGENLFAVESDKAVIEVEALENGVLYIPPDAPAPDVDVPVGAIIAYLLAPGEAAPDTPAKGHPATDAESPRGHPAPAPEADAEAAGLAATSAERTARPTMGNGQTPAISPRARRIARDLNVEWATLTGSGRTGRIVERDVRAAVQQRRGSTVRATPLARRVAADVGVDVEELATTLGGKRVSRSDVDAAAIPKEPMRTPALSKPVSPMRRITAQRMAESAHTTAPVTLTTDADATELVAVRTSIKAEAGGLPAPSYTDLLVRLVALALLEHPALNATLEDGALIEQGAVHIGVAVDTERGLLVPVTRDAHRKSVGQIAAETATLIEQARSGRVSPDDLRGGTFTITNLGMYDIDAFTPIINLPECAILGVGRIVPRLMVIDEATEKVAVRKMMALSLTFDHRVVDGAPAARFLQQVKRWIEHPFAWLTR